MYFVGLNKTTKAFLFPFFVTFVHKYEKIPLAWNIVPKIKLLTLASPLKWIPILH